LTHSFLVFVLWPKNDHYIPEFQVKKFLVDDEEKNIGRFNHGRGKFVRDPKLMLLTVLDRGAIKELLKTSGI
jgi:hypothetical protein